MDEKELIDLTKKLLGFRTISTNPNEIALAMDLIKKYLKKYQYKTFEKDSIKSYLFFNQSRLPEKFVLNINQL